MKSKKRAEKALAKPSKHFNVESSRVEPIHKVKLQRKINANCLIYECAGGGV